MLRNTEGRITDSTGKEIRLNGINLGGWLMMEGYLTGGRNIPEQAFLALLNKKMGGRNTQNLLKHFRTNFITEADIENIKKLGFNCVRLPFHYRIMTGSQFREAADYLHSAVKYCKKHGVYCILDMHAAPGSQSTDWHANCSGKSLF